jgi:hypothetical protein
MKRLLALFALAFTIPSNSFSQGTVSTVYWECGTPTPIVLHDAIGISERYVEQLPGGAWSAEAGLAVAAANYHSTIQCNKAACEVPSSPGCYKQVLWTYASILPVGQDPVTGEFTYTIRNFRVTGLCTECDSQPEE